MFLQVTDIVSNPDIIESLDLSQMMSRLNLSETPKFPTYQEIFPEKWANNSQVEQRHMDIMRRLQSWPKKEDNEVTLLRIYHKNLFNSVEP